MYNGPEVNAMDLRSVGALIRTLRREMKLTQRRLAEQLGLSAKTVSKWECGLGCPDVSLLPELSKILGVDLSSLLKGSLESNEIVGGNMKKSKFFVCPDCGSINVSTGNAQISCCGRRLSALEMKKAAENERLRVEMVEDEWFITSDHPMEKENYISFVAFASGAKLEIHKQYPEWNLQIRIPRRGHGMLIWYANDTGLMYQLV